jgi:hypothetical protein
MTPPRRLSSTGLPSSSTAATAERAESKWYDVTHHGIDAMMQRFMLDMEDFVKLPPSMQNANATRSESVHASGHWHAARVCLSQHTPTHLSALPHHPQKTNLLQQL